MVNARCARAWEVLQAVTDPEIPALTLCDLGIVREVREAEDDALDVVLTPTYSGCPATEAIGASVREALAASGLGRCRVRLQLAPAWSSDWISEAGRDKLRAAGIAPAAPAHVVRFHPVCPRCASRDTEQLSAFGATACKALWRCRGCFEPFEYFKPI